MEGGWFLCVCLCTGMEPVQNVLNSQISFANEILVWKEKEYDIMHIMLHFAFASEFKEQLSELFLLPIVFFISTLQP